MSEAASSSDTLQARSPLVRTGFAWAALAYGFIVFVLLHRLFLGEVLSPSANLWAEVPFRASLSVDLTPRLNGMQGDIWREFEPWHRYQYRSSKEVRFPLWNPHIFGGFPFHANGQTAMLSPLHWLYFVIDPKWAVGLIAAAKWWVAGFATFCLARRLGCVWSGAFVAGLSWMLCAFNVRWLLWNHTAATALLPVVLIAVERLWVREGAWRLAIASLVCAALYLTGHPETQFHVAAFSVFYAILRIGFDSASWPVRAMNLGQVAFMHVLGLGVAAIALLPFAEQVFVSADWHDATHATARLPLEGMLGALAPDHFGRPRAGRFYQGPLNYNEAALYAGLVPLVFSLSLLCRWLIWPRATHRGSEGAITSTLVILFIVCVVFVFVLPRVPAGLEYLPIFSKVNNTRLLFGMQFAAALLAAVAWTRMCDGDRGLLRVAAVVSLCVASALIVLLLADGPPGLYRHVDGLRQLLTDPTVPAPWEHRSLRTFVGGLLAVITVMWLVAMWMGLRRSGVVQSFHKHAVTFVVWTAVDLVWVAYGFNPTIAPQFVTPALPEPLQDVIKRAGDRRIIAADEILAPNLAMTYGFRDLRGYDFPIERRTARLFQRLGWNSGIVLVPSHQLHPCVRPSTQSVLDKACVRFFVARTPARTGAVAQLPVCSTGGVDGNRRTGWSLVYSAPRGESVYENATAYPRAYFARSARVASGESALDALLDVTHDLRVQSFLEEWPGDFDADRADPRGSAARLAVPDGDVGREVVFGSPGTAAIILDNPEDVQIRTNSATTGLLVISDRYDPGWRVQIDGEPARPLVTNYVFRGVIVPAGDHVVRWVYAPASFAGGAVISLISLVMIASLVIVPWVRGRACVFVTRA